MGCSSVELACAQVAPGGRLLLWRTGSVGKKPAPSGGGAAEEDASKHPVSRTVRRPWARATDWRRCTNLLKYQQQPLHCHSLPATERTSCPCRFSLLPPLQALCIGPLVWQLPGCLAHNTTKLSKGSLQCCLAIPGLPHPRCTPAAAAPVQRRCTPAWAVGWMSEKKMSTEAPKMKALGFTLLVVTYLR